MKKLVAYTFALLVGASLTGCSQPKTTTDKVETTVSTPEGETKTTVETTTTTAPAKPAVDGPAASPLAEPPDPLAAPTDKGPKAADPLADPGDPLKPIK